MWLDDAVVSHVHMASEAHLIIYWEVSKTSKSYRLERERERSKRELYVMWPLARITSTPLHHHIG